MWAHSMNLLGQRHDLAAHLRGVAALAAEFGSAFGAAEQARYLGLWHDVGKFNAAFQDYLLTCERGETGGRRGPDHKAAGAEIAGRSLGICSLAIQGHHGGLRNPTQLRSWLQERRLDPAVASAIEQARNEIPELDPPASMTIPDAYRHDQLGAELFLRFLFSALVDADYLDTERHFDPGRSGLRPAPASLHDLQGRFEDYHRTLVSDGVSAISRARRNVYGACLEAAEQPQGFFRLTVPTGGGKTLSAMAFALRHARAHGLRRIIVAVPFISITEQTADVYRAAFRDIDANVPVVLEHHSGVDDAESEDGGFELRAVKRRLAAENWDASVIVTTTVQLFESLFGRRTSRSRKVHRLAGSVLIVDEAQTLPGYLLEPILEALQRLVSSFSTTVVISTATQPAFEAIPAFSHVEAREIVSEPGPMFSSLRRVTYDWRVGSAMSWEEVAAMLRKEPQLLAIVNTKKDTLELLDALDDPEALHLSTLLCGAHRRAVLREVVARLTTGSRCRIVSTQVVEAGVDLDFPVVFRALGPLDSIIQAAGRCNREGRLSAGRVVVFRPADGGMPRGPYRIGADIAEGLLGRGDLDPDDPATSADYFRRLFGRVDTDREHIQGLRGSFDYPEVDEKFRMVEEETEAVIITQYGSDDERSQVRRWVSELRGGGRQVAGAGALLRKLQPYLVGVARRTAERNRGRGLIDGILPGVGEWLGSYDRVRGIAGEELGPESLVI